MKLNRATKVLAVLVASLAFSFTVSAQEIQDRKENQQDRIGQGVNSGQLTAGETSHLEGHEAALNHEEHSMRQADNGHLTAGDRRVLNHQQNHLSRQIYRDKHNARKQ